MDAAVATLVERDTSLYQDQRPIWNIAGAETRPPAPSARAYPMPSEFTPKTSSTQNATAGQSSPFAARGNSISPVRRRRWGLAITLGLAGGAAAAVAAWWLAADKYTAVALLKISAHENPILFKLEEDSATSFDMFKGTQQQLLVSDVVLIAALRRPEASGLAVVQKEEDPVRWLARNIRVDFPGNAEIMRVSLTSEKPEEADILVGAVADAYMNDVVDVDRNARNVRLEMLDKLYDEKEAEMRKRKSEIRSMAEQLEDRRHGRDGPQAEDCR